MVYEPTVQPRQELGVGKRLCNLSMMILNCFLLVRSMIHNAKMKVNGLKRLLDCDGRRSCTSIILLVDSDKLFIR